MRTGTAVGLPPANSMLNIAYGVIPNATPHSHALATNVSHALATNVD